MDIYLIKVPPSTKYSGLKQLPKRCYPRAIKTCF